MPLLLDYWKPVVGWEDTYEVSVTGVIRRVAQKGWHARWTVVAGSLQSKGYRVVGFTRNNRMTHHAVHRIVCAAFLGPCPDGFEVNHKARVKLNNRLSNLEYVTHAANMEHAMLTGAFRKHSRKKLNADDVRSIRQDSSSATPRELARRHNVSKGTITRILTRELWGWVE